MFDSKHLEALFAVSEEGTVSKAAKRLGLTQPAVSERLRQLENQAGRPLFVRSSPVRLTPAGERLTNLFHQYQILHQSAVQQWGMDDAGVTRISIAVNFDSLWTWFPKAVVAMIATQPIKIEIQAMDQSQTMAALRSGNVIGCISQEENSPAGCVAERLGAMEYICLASEGFYQSHFLRELKGKDMAAVPAIIYGKDDKLHEEFLKKIFPRGFSLPSYHWVPSLHMMREMVLAGAGYAVMPSAFGIAPGLKRVFEKSTLTVPLFWHRTSIESELLETLSQSVVDGARQFLSR